MGLRAISGSEKALLLRLPGLGLLIIWWCWIALSPRGLAAGKTSFDTSTRALVALQRAGAGGEIIRWMVNPAAETSYPSIPVAPEANPSTPPALDKLSPSP